MDIKKFDLNIEKVLEAWGVHDALREVIANAIDEQILSKTKDIEIFKQGKYWHIRDYGQVLKRGKRNSRIYIHGVRVAEEDNFLFSYNITSLTSKMRKALNRERTNVGRTAYTDRIKTILLECTSKDVAEFLVNDLKMYEMGEAHDELNWIDVSVHACKLLNSQDKVIFLTPYELIDAKDMVDRAIDDGFIIITIPASIKEKIKGLKDLQGNPVRDLDEYTAQWNESFEFNFVKQKDLSEREKKVFSKTGAILDLIGGRPKNVKKILISETMRIDASGYHEAVGLWEEHKQRVIIKRDQLKKLETYAGTLLHEIGHAISGASDITKDFEMELTRIIGIVSSKGL